MTFISYKKSEKNKFFSVNIDILYNSNHWLKFGESELEVQNSVSKDDYTFIFMDDLIGTKPYLGHFQFDMNYLSDIRFNGQYLFFTTTEEKTVRLS
jgi:hypothetical protein